MQLLKLLTKKEFEGLGQLGPFAFRAVMISSLPPTYLGIVKCSKGIFSFYNPNEESGFFCLLVDLCNH